MRASGAYNVQNTESSLESSTESILFELRQKIQREERQVS